MKSIYNSLFALLLLTAGLFAQTTATADSKDASSAKPAQPPMIRKTDRAAAYYHYMLAHMYEEQVAVYGRSDLANKAIEEYRQAIESDPTSEYLTSGLAELYFRTGRIRDAVVEAQDVLKRDPSNLESHKLLGRIYVRSIGDQGNPASRDMLKRAIEQYEQIIKIQPDSVDDHLLLGRLYKANNDLQKAEAEFRTAVQLDPGSEESITTLALLYSEEGDTTRATQVLSSIPDSARSYKLYLALGYTYEQQKQYKSAIDAYRHAVELDRDNLDAIRGLADNLLNDGQTDAALEQYKVIADANPEDAQTYLKIAEIYRKSGRYDQALENLKKAQSMVEESDEAPYYIAAIYQTQGRYDEAIQVLQTLLKKTEKPDPSAYKADEKNNRALFLERLGLVYRDSDNDVMAIETFRKMMALGDENAVRAYQEIIDTYREAKQWQQATDAAKEATQKFPNDRTLKMTYATQIAETGQADDGVQKLKAMLKGTNEDRDVYMTLASLYTRLRRWQDAEDAIDKATKLSSKPEEKQAIDFLRGSILERQKKYDQAEELFRKVITTDSQNATALNYLGYMLADRGVKLDEALTLIKKAVDLDPANGAYLDSLGWAYFRLGKYDLAEESLTKASQHISSDPTVQDHLGDLYQKTGRLKLAAAHWERALNEWNKTVAAEQDPEDVSKVQKKLESAKIKLAKEDSGNK